MNNLTPFLELLSRHENLSLEQSHQAFHLIMSGQIDPIEISAFLMGLRMKGEGVDEIMGATQVMRENALSIQAPDDAIDTCGTGGDGHHTYNISTAAAFVVAGCGVRVAKHGNKSASSKSGSADVLEALGVKFKASKDHLMDCLKQAHICFMMAPLHHQAMKYVVPVRKQLKMRTIFNILGPLSNPAQVKRQFIGVFDAKWMKPMTEVLGRLGSKKAWVIHGYGQLDELSTLGPNQVVQWDGGKITHHCIDPQELGFSRPDLSEIQGGSPQINAQAMKDIFSNKPGAYQDIVILNAAGALVVADAAKDMKEGILMAKDSLKKGWAMDRLNQLISMSNEG